MRVEWNSFARNPVALLILPWDQGGFTIAKRDRDGRLVGCRDVSAKASYPTDCLTAWIETERANGLAIEDHAGVLPELSAQGASL